MQHTNLSRSLHKRALALLLALALCLGLVPGFPGLSEEAAAHWADTYLEQMVEWNLIRPDQAEQPDEYMTRADFMAIVNRAYGYTETGPTPFEDINEDDWFYDDVRIAYTANYIKGTGPTTVSPNEMLTRETSATILGRNMMLKESEGEILDFSDARDISAWARGTIKSSLEHYLVDGYEDGTFQPQRDLTWGEMAAMVTRIVGMPIQESGDYTLGGVYGNVTVSADGVTLRDSIISGDLYVTGGVGLGGVKLENVTVLGRIIASGSGESESGEASIVLRNVTADELLVDNLQNNYVTVRVDGITEIGNTIVRTGSYLEDNSPEGLGLKNISLEGEDGTRLDLAGRIETVTVKTPNAQVRAAKGTVASMTVDENAPGTNVTIDRGAEIKELNLDIGTYVTGDGDIKKLTVNAEGCVVTMLPEEVHIRPGITAVINNQIMDATSAEEASREPMILSGYPLANDIAPTSLQAVFATNKKGTVYWAVSPITDGSVATEDLIHKPAYGGISVAQGSVAIPAADELVGVTVGTPTTTGTNRPNANNNSPLTPGGSYYLAAVLVDDRGVQSPTKVIAFTLPDNSAPAFAEGYPYFSLITNNMAQITVMPTKTCKLYYAVLPTGAVAPTEAEFRSNAIVGNLGYGIRDVIKNTEDVFQVNDKTLEELESYDLYLWLVDSDGANKSAIIKLPFTTVDRTPPVFDPRPTPTTVQATSVGLTFQVNEDATVYWVVVPAGTDYPKVNPQTGTKDDEYSRLQIEKGMGNVLKSGNVNAKAFTDGTINVTGLQAESAYDLWYVAKDTAGNYSTPVGMVTIYTLDTNGPRVRQFFTEYVGEDNTKRPTSETDVVLEFNENVRATDSEGFAELYTAYYNNRDNAEAKNKFLSAIKSTIKLYKIDPNTGRPAEAPVKGADGAGTDWAIDYEQVEVKVVEGALQVIFKNAGLKLDAGSTYYFQIANITDVSTAQNPIVPTTVNYETPEVYGHNVPVIEIEFALVNLSSPGVGAKDAPYERELSSGVPTVDANGKAVYKKDYVLDENGAHVKDEDGNDVYNDVFATVDLSFRMIPQSTSRVDDNISYDILLWADTSCTYDLYYRILDKNNNAITDPKNTVMDASDPDKKTYEQYLLPTRSGFGTPDERGWFYLGESGAVNSSSGELAGKSVNGYFNGCDATSFPQLNNLNENLRYEFVITLKSIGTSTDRNAWSGEIHFHNYVAAGWSNRLNSLSQGLSWSTWERLQQGGLATGAKSIGLWLNDGKSLDYIDVYQLFTNVSLPKFLGEAPIFHVGSTSVKMALALDNPGDIYYVIGKANASGLPKGKPEITTTISEKKDGHEEVPGSNGKEWYILPSDVPHNGTGGVQPALVLPDRQNIFNPSGWAAASKAKTGKVNCPSVAEIEEEVTGLEANTTYYAYFVIKGAAQELSRVYIYQFTTTDRDKPRILLNSESSGDVELRTDIASTGYYRTLTVSDAAQIAMLHRPFSTFVAGGPAEKAGKEVPGHYLKDGADDTFTLLDALTTPYNYQDAKAQCGYDPDTKPEHANKTAEDVYYFPERNGDYTSYNEYGGGIFTVFDIYANDQSRAKMYGLIRDTNPGYGEERPTAQWGPSGAMSTPANYGDHMLKIGSKINYSQYIILTFAQNKDVPASYQVATFRAMTFRKTSLVPPNLINVIATENLTPGTVSTYNGKFTFYFDAPIHVYTSRDGNHVPLTSNNLLNPTFVTIPGGDITVSNVTDRSFTLEFKNMPTGNNTTFNGGFFSSESGEPAMEALNIKFTEDTQSAYMEVTWGVPKDPDYGIWTGLGRPSGSAGGGVAFLSGSPVNLGGDYNGYTLELDSDHLTTTLKIDMVNPDPGTTPIVEWSVSPANIVKLEDAGTKEPKVTAVGMGDAVISLALTYGAGKTITQTVRVTVKAPETLKVSIKPGTNAEAPINSDKYTWTPATGENSAELKVDLGTLTDTVVNWSIVSGNGVIFDSNSVTNKATMRILHNNGGDTRIRVAVGSGTQTVSREFTITTPSPAASGSSIFDNIKKT